MLFGTWLQSARAHARETGTDHRQLACHPAELTRYVQDRTTQMLLGLEKLYMWLPPTPYDEQTQREMWENFRPEYIRALREVADHLGEALAAVGCTEVELEEAGQAPEEPETSDEGDTTEPVDSSSEETTLLPIPLVLQDEDDVEEIDD